MCAALAAAWLVGFGHVAPAAAVDLGATDPNLQAAYDLLSSDSDTAGLVQTLADTGVTVQYISMPPRIYARYSVARKVIEIDSQWQEAGPITLAAVIAHEATHAQDAMSGYLSAGGGVACVDSEIRAFRNAARFWTAQYGPQGKRDATDELERQLNLIAQRQLNDPVGLEQLIRQAYTDQCGTA